VRAITYGGVPVNLDSLAMAGPLAIVVIAGLVVAGKCIVALGALRGAKSEDRAAIIKAISDLFKIRRW
jgi:hypothetical protein